MSSRIPEAEARQVMLDADLEPLEPYPGGGQPWKCRCMVCATEVTPRYDHIKQGRGCPSCGRKRAGLKHRTPSNDAVALMRAAGLEPLEVYPGSHTPWRCRCMVCGAEVTPRYGGIRNGQGGCVPCGRTTTGLKKRTPTTEAVALMRAAGLEPLEPYQGSQTPWRCRCTTCKTEVTPQHANVKAGHSGCTHCAGWGPVDPDEAVAVMVAAGLEPLEPYPGSKKPWRCCCTTCGEEVAPTHGDVTRGTGCRVCGGTAPLSHEAASAVMVAAGLEPLEPYSTASAPWRCRCTTCGLEGTPAYANVNSGAGGCRFCADFGFDLSAPALLYLIQHPGLSAAKVGISGLDTHRLRDHKRGGWRVVATWEFDVGADAETVEGAALSWWREELGVSQALAREDMPIGGATETAWLADVDIDETVAFIERLIAAG